MSQGGALGRVGSPPAPLGTYELRVVFGRQPTVQLGHRRDPRAGTPEALVTYMIDRLEPAAYDSQVAADLLDYANAGGVWTGSPGQVRAKAAGLAHLIGGSSEYQFV